MADMAEIIDRDPAGIHPHLFSREGKELFFFIGQGVVDAKGHKSILKRNNGTVE
jgi:hypothetical protein